MYCVVMARPRGYKQRTTEINKRLKEFYPVVKCALDHENPYQLLVATILSAQCTDKRVNIVTPALFKKYPNPSDIASASQVDVEKLIQSTGFFHNKAKNIIAMAQRLVSAFGGEVPENMEDLVTLPGTGRKTANVILHVAFAKPGIPVDTHVSRLCNRLKITVETDPVKIEFELNKLIDPSEGGDFSLRLIEHGRQICDAKKPKCNICFLSDICPSFGKFDKAKKH
ncbi:MAG: endonuclease III [Acidimicrobiia bacterium]|nr:endonuclease III [Acidimicrobiia bacterium]